ncbi:MAG: hypothetical protein U9R32_04510 [Bacteroidota bacterium]|nr:hypothetical protein [Bacteroidota bacterium]
MKKQRLFILTLLISFIGLNAAKAQKEDGFTFGGAMRYNIMATSYESDANATSPQFTWDTWRLNVDGSVKGVDLSFEYRFYPTFNTHFIHHGFLGYALSDKVYMELGATQVPFGITTYASHSWWFQGAYYVGLEDDYDMGINFDIKPSEKIDLSLSYFRQAEPQGPGYDGVNWSGPGAGRYSYDITPSEGKSIRELNQFNGRLAYHVNSNWEIGASAQVGGIYNSVLEESEISTVFAGHVVGNFGNFNLKAQYTHYNYAAKDDEGNDLDIVQMGAYGSNYGVAAEADIYMAGLAYSVPVEFGPISNVQFYVDYTMIDKTNEDFFDTQHLVPGMLITAGSIYTYVDYAMGKNQPWLTDNFGKGLGAGVEDPDWMTRFNINIGYYF